MESIVVAPASYSAAGIVVANDEFVVVATLIQGEDRDHCAGPPATMGDGATAFN